MAMMISCRYEYVQFIDDEKGVTLASVSTLGQKGKNNVASAKLLGERAGKCALERGIKSAVVDRGGFKFHGRVKAVVDAARAAGLRLGSIKEEK
jgi:large subunit ribosomal protein L18